MNTEYKTLNAFYKEYMEKHLDQLNDLDKNAFLKSINQEERSADKYYSHLKDRIDKYGEIFPIPEYTKPDNQEKNKYNIPEFICKLAEVEADYTYFKEEMFPNLPSLSPNERTQILNSILQNNWNKIMKKDCLAIFFFLYIQFLIWISA